MKNSERPFLKAVCGVLAVLLLGQNQIAFAGYTSFVNGNSVGWVSVNVRSSTLVTNRLTTLTNALLPSAAMAPTTGYKTNAPLPRGASTSTYARARTFSGGVVQGYVNAANGDGTDNTELQKRAKITPADCASLSFESKIDQTPGEFAANGNSGSISVNATATAGTAMWVRGFEFTGSMGDVPVDNPDTVENESVEYLKINGVAKFEALVLGPFEFGGSKNPCPLVIPFTLGSSNLEHLVYATDAVALSLPLVVYCPGDIVVKCNDSFSYPPVQYAGCGEISISYSPAPLAGPFPPGSFPVGVNEVTVTATDTNGHMKTCKFNVTVTDTDAPTPPALPTLTGEASVTVPQPEPAFDECGGFISATTKDPLVYNTQGTFTVRWLFDDNHGNVAAADQRVVVDDVTPPAAPTLPVVSAECSVTVQAPTTTDAVAGTIIGTTTDPLTYSSQGTFTVRWTFDDRNGNTRTATQTVVIKDTKSPVTPLLPILTGNCANPVILTNPIAADECVGLVPGTTSSPLAVSATGTNKIVWTFNDGNGNSISATQTVIISGLEFHGFYPPINGAGGSCTSPLRQTTVGNNLPIKFDVTCGGTPYGAGSPTLSIERSSDPANPCGALVSVGGGGFTQVNNEWHFNWDTTGQLKGHYKLTATLQDGSKQTVWIKLK